jgi:stage II sporulation protein R
MSKVLLMIKEIGNLQHIQKLFRTGFVLVLTVITVFAMFAGSYSESVNTGLSDSLIRLHVIANSDSTEDQALKRDVRDVILDYMKSQLNSSQDIEQTRFIINQKMDEMTAIAKNQIAKEGKDYSVKVMLGSYPFPTKEYGDITLPAGNYQALRVVIGKGEGANRWCVLFPPLCFVDATNGSLPEDSKQKLKASLSEEEYSLLTSQGGNDLNFKIKFKSVEVWQNSKHKVQVAVDRIF